MTTSGTSDWTLDNAGLITEAFSRLAIHPTALTREHFISATRSLNLALQSFSNRGVNLWQVDLQSIPLIQGVTTYTLPSNTVNILDAYLETYQLGTTVNQAPNFSTVLNSTTVTVNQPAHGLSTGNWVEVVTQIAVGGIVLYGFYQATVQTGDIYTIQSATAAASTINNGGVVPSFTTTNGSPTITCALTNHGLAPNEDFAVQVSTTVGSIPLFGNYTVGSVIDANTFTFSAQYNASVGETVFENLGQVQLQTQAMSADPIDRIMTSVSRTDYAAYPDKLQQGYPSTFWFDRLSPIPTVTLWLVPDQNGPYTFNYYRMRRLQDASPTSGQTADIPYLFLDALAAELAMRLARKYAQPLMESLKMDAAEAWAMAAEENRERVQTFIVPDTSGYFR